ncbi:MAG: DNA recombination protein RmuC, partial [bacterium]|nr:DNA recombination protein RmuC [bacterium]
MSAPFLILIGVVVAGFAGLFWLLIGRSGKAAAGRDGLVLLQNQMNALSQRIDQRLGESTQLLQAQFDSSTRMIQDVAGKSARIIQDVTEKLTRLDETNRQVVGFADQLKHLQDILKNPKQRGILGEYYL